MAIYRESDIKDILTKLNTARGGQLKSDIADRMYSFQQGRTPGGFGDYYFNSNSRYADAGLTPTEMMKYLAYTAGDGTGGSYTLDQVGNAIGGGWKTEWDKLISSPSDSSSSATSTPKYERATGKDVSELASAIGGTSLRIQMGAKVKDLKGYKQLADYMGVKNINSKREISRALSILGGFNDPYAAAVSASKGVNYYNSLNDYLRGLGPSSSQSRQPSAVASTTPTPSAVGSGALPSYETTPLSMGSTTGSMPSTPTETATKFMPGGAGASVDGGALGFRRKKSSARAAGMTTKGTGQFKIASSLGKGTGLNIGV